VLSLGDRFAQGHPPRTPLFLLRENNHFSGFHFTYPLMIARDSRKPAGHTNLSNDFA
jgi:hypothetical protein